MRGRNILLTVLALLMLAALALVIPSGGIY